MFPALFVFTGTVPWTAFNGSIVGVMGIIDEARGTLAKVNFPHESPVLTAFGKSVVYTRATAVFVIPFLLIYRIPLDFQYAAVPVGGSGDVNLRNRLGDGCRPDDGAVQRFRASDPSGSTLFFYHSRHFPSTNFGMGLSSGDYQPLNRVLRYQSFLADRW